MTLIKDGKDLVDLPVIECLSDTSRLLSDIHRDESIIRRSLVASNINPTLKEAVSQTTCNEWLFGEKLDEIVKTAKAFDATAKDLRATAKNTSSRGSKNFNNPPCQRWKDRQQKTSGGYRTDKPYRRQQAQMTLIKDGKDFVDLPVIECLSDTSRLLSDIQPDESIIRRSLVASNINPTLKEARFTVFSLPFTDSDSYSPSASLKRTFEERTFVPPLHSELVLRCKDVIEHGLPEEEKANLLKKYPPPENCLFLDPPKLNAETKRIAQPTVISRDDRIFGKQRKIAAALSAVAKAQMTLIKDGKDFVDLPVIECLSDTSRLLSDIQPDESIIRLAKAQMTLIKDGKDLVDLPVIECLSDTSRLLSDIHRDESIIRRSLVASNINPTLKEAVSQTTCNEWLFGEKLDEIVKTAKAFDATAKDLRATAKNTSSRGSKNFNNPPCQRWKDRQQKTSGCLRNVSITKMSSEKFGFIINYKRKLVPKQKCTYLGFICDAIRLTIQLPDEKRKKVTRIANLERIKILKFERFLVSCCTAVEYGYLYTKISERATYLVLEANRNNYEAKMIITTEIIKELRLWKYLDKPICRIRNSAYDLEVYSDASLT
ncbi:hypothetical protein TSAR_006217, partial [Trichomalopsis sarcophagae]